MDGIERAGHFVFGLSQICLIDIIYILKIYIILNKYSLLLVRAIHIPGKVLVGVLMIE